VVRDHIRKAKTTAGPGWKSPVMIGALVGAGVGLLEVAALWASPTTAVTREHTIVAALLYGAAGALAGLALLVLAALVRRRPPTRALSGSVVVAVFFFILAGGYLNVSYLPSATSGLSLLVTGAVLAASIGLGAALFTLLRRLGRRPSVARFAEGGLGHLGWIVGVAVAVVAIVVSYLPVGGGWRGGPREQASRTNVLMIVIDALRSDHLSAYGYERPTTPRIDEWAAEGVLFENAYAQASWTKPSTATLLTGLYASAHGVNLVASGLPRSLKALPEIMKECGYRTGVFTDNWFVSPVFGFQRGVDFFVARQGSRFTQLTLGHLTSVLKNYVPWMGPVYRAIEASELLLVTGDPRRRGYGADGLRESFLAWVDEAPEAPFFAYFHCMEPHAPYSPPVPYDTEFLPADLAGHPKVTDHPPFNGLLPFDSGRPISADSLTSMLALYDGEILRTDGSMGALFEGLRGRGLFDRTLIVLTADHGEEFYEHGGWGHGYSLFEEVLRVPLLLSCPDAIGRPGARLTHAVRHIDVLPTVLDVCGLSVPEGLDGTSLIPIVSGEEPPDPPRPVMSEVYHGGHFARSLIEGTEKVIFSQRGWEKSVLLFDLASDPGEMNDLAVGDPASADELLATLEEFHAIAAEKAASGYTIAIDDQTRERLKALGYIQ